MPWGRGAAGRAGAAGCGAACLSAGAAGAGSEVATVGGGGGGGAASVVRGRFGGAVAGRRAAAETADAAVPVAAATGVGDAT